MPRRPRADEAGGLYHALNRGNAGQTISLFSFQLMPNHWHLVLRPNRNGAMSDFLRWVTATHTMRYHAHYHNSGQGHVYQGRFKSFPIQDDEHFLKVCRYVERNALRAGLTNRAEAWRWSSLFRWLQRPEPEPKLLPA
jgi:putative transposase